MVALQCKGVPYSSFETEGSNTRFLRLTMPEKWSCHLSRGLPADETKLLEKGGCLYTNRWAISKGPPALKTRTMSSYYPIQ